MGSGYSPRIVRALLVAGFAALVAASLWLRVVELGRIPGVNADESWYGVWAIDAAAGRAVRWFTPSGNVLNPFFLGPVWLLHEVFPPSVALLRVAALCSGLLALAVNYLLCRWVFDRRTAAVSTLLLAVLPLNIAYSRFAWDTSQSLLFGLPPLYLGLAAVRGCGSAAARGDERQFARGARWSRWCAVGAFLTLMPAAMVHVTNLLAATAVLSALALTWSAHASTAWPAPEFGHGSGARPRRLWPIALAAFALASLAVGGYLLASLGPSIVASRIQGVQSLLRPKGLAIFMALYARLFTGQLVYSHISGGQSWLLWPADGPEGVWGLDVALVTLTLALCVGTLVRRQFTAAAADPADRALLGAWALGLAAFALVVGPVGVIPGYERYAIALIAPAVLVVSRAMPAPRGLRGAVAYAALFAVAALLLADFHSHYLTTMRISGGEAALRFRTARVEPKQAAARALAEIAAARDHADRPLRVATHEYWLYWPLRYALADEREIEILAAGDEVAGIASPANSAAAVRGERSKAAAKADGPSRGALADFAVEFSNSDAYHRLVEDGARVVRTIADAAGRPVVVILRADAVLVKNPAPPTPNVQRGVGP